MAGGKDSGGELPQNRSPLVTSDKGKLSITRRRVAIAAVAGVVPVIRVLGGSLAGARVDRIHGIVNGTTNFILTKMTEEGADYMAALTEAQALGYAERDPTADVEGFDAAAKAAILATLAFHHTVTDKDVYREGITKLTARDIAIAKDMGMVIKLLAIAENIDDENSYYFFKKFLN